MKDFSSLKSSWLHGIEGRQRKSYAIMRKVFSYLIFYIVKYNIRIFAGFAGELLTTRYQIVCFIKESISSTEQPIGLGTFEAFEDSFGMLDFGTLSWSLAMSREYRIEGIAYLFFFGTIPLKKCHYSDMRYRANLLAMLKHHKTRSTLMIRHEDDTSILHHPCE